MSGASSAAEGIEVSPNASDEEVAAIMAAYEALWPKPVVAAGEPAPDPSLRWRFSGRWWSKPVALRRGRPGSH